MKKDLTNVVGLQLGTTLLKGLQSLIVSHVIRIQLCRYEQIFSLYAAFLFRNNMSMQNIKKIIIKKIVVIK